MEEELRHQPSVSVTELLLSSSGAQDVLQPSCNLIDTPDPGDQQQIRQEAGPPGLDLGPPDYRIHKGWNYSKNV